MESLSVQWIDAILLGGWIVAAVLTIRWLTARARRRANELKTTAAALASHYDAVERLVDDPALPLSALEFISTFSEVIADRDACAAYTNEMLKVPVEQARAKPLWATEIERAGKTRPDLEENFHKAVSSGIIALFLRWPGNSWKFQTLVQQIAADRRKEMLVADQVTSKYRDRNHKNGNGGPLLPGGLVPA